MLREFYKKNSTIGYILSVTLIFVIFSFSVNAQTFYKTPSGKKYHLATCHMVKNVSEAITINEAKELGLEPCKICKPESVSSETPTKKAKGEAYTTVQCRGLTKAGTRCKHMTSIANGYCYQHQPE
jgi:methylphosphotriester-DNA--protein-cysteine methyltransferase